VQDQPRGSGKEACPACGAPNRSGAKFCGECGHGLAVEPCPECGSENPSGQKFCNECGAALAAAPAPQERFAPPELPERLSRKLSTQGAALEGERKQVSVMFADVVGSMELAERTDPERWRAIMDRFFGLLADAVHRFEGTVDKFTGDGIMALFGAPIAHEDHAQRACYAALESQRAVSEFSAELRATDGISLGTRIGINSGEVVVGSIGEAGNMKYTAVGHTVGLAQRMEALAEPGKAYVSQATARLAAGFLDLDDLGESEVKGASEPLRVFELTGVGSARGRLDVASARGFSRFVGRAAEMAQLDAGLALADKGDGEVIGIVAEAGIGKSRLCREFAERCRARGIEVYETQCQAHGRSLPLMPVLQMMRAYFGIEPGDSERTARERIAGRLLLLDPGFAEDLGLVFDFLAVPDPERPAPALNPEARQRRLVDLVRRLVQARGRDRAAVNLVEDLHWVDPASEEFLRALVEAAPGTRTLVVINFRPEYRAGWMSHTYYRQLPLAPLGPEALDELLGDLLGADPSLDGLAELIRDRTGGNPFFVEEAVLELAESGTLAGERGAYKLVRQIDDIAVPPTVQAILAARIDRLAADAKTVLQAAAAIGKEFGRGLIALAVELDEAALDDALRELVEAEFVYETALYPEPEYAFRHPLTQEVAYGSQLAAGRAKTHARIAAGLQETESERLDEQAGLIAQHYERAEMGMEAAMWHARAAGWAGFNDPEAARDHWSRIRELDGMLPEGDEADGARMVARLMMLATGWRLGADLDEARQVFAECTELAERRGDTATLALAHGVLAVAEGTCGGNVPEYVRLAERTRAIGERLEDPGAQVATLTALMYPFYLAGRQHEALESLDRIVELTKDDPELGVGIAIANPRAWATAFRAPPLIALGRLDEAREAAEAGAELCRRWDRESLGWTQTFYVNLVRSGVGEFDAETLAHGRRAAEIADAIGDGFSRVIAYTWLGYTQLRCGEPDQGLESLERCLATIEGRGVGLEYEPAVRAYRARALAALGNTEVAVQEGELAVRLAEERGAALFVPTVRLELAVTLRERNTAGDAERAAALLDAALSEVAEMGVLPDIVQVRAERARLRELTGDAAGRDADRVEALALAREIGADRFVAELEAETAVAAT
jgi:class 3 adenylate cyclase/tetratricopeptide (TPR) repeat protein